MDAEQSTPARFPQVVDGQTDAVTAARAGTAPRRLLTRRRFLNGAAGLVVVGVAGGGWRAHDQGVFATGEGPAYAPWRAWPPDVARDGPVALVGAAILAANPHNTQPWRFAVAPHQIDLLADAIRGGGVLDPFRREQHLGLGCALENLLLAARANAYDPALQLLPDPTRADLLARVELAPARSQAEAASTELYHAIPDRHTDRAPFREDRPVVPAILDALTAIGEELPEITVRWFTSDVERRRFGDLVIAANEAIDADEEQADETARWFRHSWDAVQRERDGLTIDAGGVSPLGRAIGKMLPRQFVPTGLSAKPVRSAPVFGLIVAREAEDPAQLLHGGRLWQRLHLWATAHDLAMQPLDSPLVRADRERSLGLPPTFGEAAQALIDAPGWQPVLPFRLGYPTRRALASPRRPVAAVMIG